MLYRNPLDTNTLLLQKVSLPLALTFFSKFKINCYKYNRHPFNTDQIISMNPSVSILMGFDCKCKCYLFTHEHLAGAHTFHLELEFRIVGKTEVSRKKTSQSKGQRTNNKLNPHYGVNVIHKIC